MVRFGEGQVKMWKKLNGPGNGSGKNDSTCPYKKEKSRKHISY